MNKVITINLNGNAYQLEEDGFEALRRYLDSAAHRLEGNPDKAEIIADIEQSIGDKFRALLGPNKSVVVTKEVEEVIAEMGPVQDASEAPGGPEGPGPSAAGPAGAAADGTFPHRRLYRIREGAKLGGVCNGLAAYFGIEVTIVRLLFIFITITYGTGILLYLVMMFIVPAADSPAEKAEAFGTPATAKEFIRRAKEGYYGGMRTFRDKKAYREWKWKFKQEMRQHRRDFQRELHRNIHQWRHDWGQRFGQPHPHDSWIAGSFLSLLITIISIIGLCAVVSLVLTGSIFKYSLPAGVPLWMGIVFLFLLFHIIKWPLRVARHSVYYGGPGYWGAGSFFMGTFWWLAVLIFALWFASHHSPRAHEVLEQVRRESHQFVDSVREWWDKP